MMEALAGAAASQVHALGPQQLANIAWAFAKVRSEDPVLFGELADAAIAKQHDFRPQGLANLAWAFAKTACFHEQLFGEMAAWGPRWLPSCNPQELSNLAWAFVTAGRGDSAMLDALDTLAASRVKELAPQGLANIAWAFATAALHHSRFMEVAVPRAEHDIGRFRPQELTNLLWACGKLGLDCKQLLDTAATQVSGALGKYQPQNLANLAWAYAALGYFPPALFAELASEATRKRSGLSRQGLASLASAFAKAAINDDGLFRMVASEVFAEAHGFNEQELANIVWAFAAAGRTDAAVYDTIAKAAVASVDRFKPQELSSIAWAYATVRRSQEVLFRRIAEAATHAADALTPQSASNLIWAFARVGADCRAFISSLRAVCRGRLQDFSPQHLSAIAWACATLALHDRGLLDDIAVEAEGRVGEFSPQGLSNLAWAFTALEVGGGRGRQLLEAVEAQLLGNARHFDVRHASRGSLVAFASDLASTLWALCSSRRHVDAGTLTTIQSILRRVGSRLDATLSSPRRMPTPLDAGLLGSSAAASARGPSFGAALPRGAEEEPSVNLELRDRMVILKPPNWEVERNNAAEGREDLRKVLQLSDFVRSRWSPTQWPILGDPEHHYGFLHRLDVPSSGLILTAKTYKAYYDLLFQLNTDAIERDYLLLCHGWVPPEVRDIYARVYWAENSGSRPGEVRTDGKPSRTLLKALQRVFFNGAAYSIVGARIRTGRMHQIRIHTAHIAHPTVCDGRYTGMGTFKQDTQWCPRNFLHRYRLHFHAADGTAHVADQPLPLDLYAVLVNITSASLHGPRWSDRSLPPWDAYEVLSPSLQG